MKILFVTSNRLGDAVLSTGLLDHLIRSLPERADHRGLRPGRRGRVRPHAEPRAHHRPAQTAMGPALAAAVGDDRDAALGPCRRYPRIGACPGWCRRAGAPCSAASTGRRSRNSAPSSACRRRPCRSPGSTKRTGTASPDCCRPTGRSSPWRRPRTGSRRSGRRTGSPLPSSCWPAPVPTRCRSSWAALDRRNAHGRPAAGRAARCARPGGRPVAAGSRSGAATGRPVHRQRFRADAPVPPPPARRPSACSAQPTPRSTPRPDAAATAVVAARWTPSRSQQVIEAARHHRVGTRSHRTIVRPVLRAAIGCETCVAALGRAIVRWRADPARDRSALTGQMRCAHV